MVTSWACRRGQKAAVPGGPKVQTGGVVRHLVTQEQVEQRVGSRGVPEEQLVEGVTDANRLGVEDLRLLDAGPQDVGRPVVDVAGVDHQVAHGPAMRGRHHDGGPATRAAGEQAVAALDERVQMLWTLEHGANLANPWSRNLVRVLHTLGPSWLDPNQLLTDVGSAALWVCAGHHLRRVRPADRLLPAGRHAALQRRPVRQPGPGAAVAGRRLHRA